MSGRKFISSVLGLWGGVLFFLAVVGLGRSQEPFASWFYAFAWWSYILLADCLIFRLKGQSLLLNRFSDFCFMLPISVTCWLIFEAVNLAMGNWRYVGLPASPLLRWPGYILSFATVFPGLFQTAALLEAAGLFPGLPRPSRPLGPSWYVPSVILGLFCLIFPLTQPRYGFAFIWVAFIFLLEPFCHWGGGKSLLADWVGGRRREIFLLLAAGFTCGFLWELWNYWAKAKWVYNLPFFHWGKIFEMPLLGYLGFPPFALECAIMYNFSRLLRDQSLPSRRARRYWWLIQGLFWLIMFWALDTWTVVSGK